jgi:ribosomal protein L18
MTKRLAKLIDSPGRRPGRPRTSVAVGCLLLWRLVVHDRNNDAIQVQLYRDNARVVGLMAVATSQDLQANLRSNELGFIAFGQRTNNEQAILNSLYHRAVRLITERRHGHDLGTPWLEGMKR